MQNIVSDKVMPEDYGIIRHAEGVDLLPSNIELSAFEVGLFNTMSREMVLKNYLDTEKKNYDYVLIDCMPSLGMMTINSLVAADSVLIPSQPNFLSAKGLGLLLKFSATVSQTFDEEQPPRKAAVTYVVIQSGKGWSQPVMPIRLSGQDC